MSDKRKPRGKQARPTREELASYYSLLRAKAGEGDIQASALLIALAERRPLLPVETVAA